MSEEVLDNEIITEGEDGDGTTAQASVEESTAQETPEDPASQGSPGDSASQGSPGDSAPQGSPGDTAVPPEEARAELAGTSVERVRASYPPDPPGPSPWPADRHSSVPSNISRHIRGSPTLDSLRRLADLERRKMSASKVSMQSSGKGSGFSGFGQNSGLMLETGKEVEIQDAKAYLLKISTISNLNLYDHLANVLTKILDERPENVVDIFETLSKTMKREKYVPSFDVIRDEYEPSMEFHLAETQRRLFEKASDADLDMEPDEEAETPLPNVMDIMYHFEQVGIGFGREECYRIFLAMNQLVEAHPLSTARFWGKILGTEKNYLIAEVQFREGEDEEEEEDEDKEGAKEEKVEEEEEEEEGEKDDAPKPDYKPPAVIPKEDNRTGVNKFAYFVCNSPGGPWTRLPPVTPAHITASRKIRKLFTGNLEASVVSYPPFPGTEANYLRAQVARISASTNISPLGYYQFDDEDEDEEETEGQTEFVDNPDFEGIPLRELIDPSLANWVHHVQYVLPQGRCTWFNPMQKGEEDYEEEEEEEDAEEPEEPEPEVGPPLLNPLSEDMEGESISPWSCKLSSSLLTQYAVAILKSNMWPGAVAYSDGKKFENLYVGLGHKYDASNFSPDPQPPIQTEYVVGPDITEAEDPSVEEEAALKAAQEEAAAAAEDMEEMEEDEEDDD